MDRKLTNLMELLDQGLNRGLKHSVVGGAGHNRYSLNIDSLSAEDAFTARLAFEMLPTITTVYVPTTLLK